MAATQGAKASGWPVVEKRGLPSCPSNAIQPNRKNPRSVVMSVEFRQRTPGEYLKIALKLTQVFERFAV
jgi:hypothetical protein